MKQACALIVAALLPSTAALGQETTGDVLGRLRAPDGSAIAGATVTATSPDLLGRRTARSAADGVFQILALPPGTYTLRVAQIGFRLLTIENVHVRLGRTEGLPDTRLEPATAELSEITIVAPRVTLDPARTTIGATLEASDYARLPADRDYKSLMSILPHANLSYHGDAVNVGGSTGLENVYYIDGVNVTAPGNAATGTSLPYNFVRSVEVRSGGYEAKYGRALGAIVNAVTYTGTNEFETGVFGFFTNDALSLTPRTVQVVRETSSASYDMGFRVSGPVVRDRAWFSAAWNPRVARADKSISGLGTLTDERRAQVFAGKLTWQPSPASRVEASVFGDPTTHDRVATLPWLTGLTPLNADPYLWQDKAGGVSASLRAGTTIGASGSIEGTLSRFAILERKAGATARGRDEPLYVDYLAGTIEGGVGIFDESKQTRTAFTVRGSWSAGAHTIEAGGEYEDAAAAGTFFNPGIGYIERQQPNSYAVYAQFTESTVRNRTPAAYLQDSWRANNSLTLNAGLRWSSQNLVGASGRTAQRFPGEWQPRIGFSWQLDDAGRRRLLGSAGRFYLLEPLALAGGYFVDYTGTVTLYSADPRTPGVPIDSKDGFSSTEADFPEVEDLSVENVDEIALGYEQLIGSNHRVTVRGVRRALRSTYQQGIDSLGRFILGTPGKGDLAFLPSPRREYTALEMSLDGTWGAVRYRASYVLSRTYGNFTGLYSSDGYVANPGNNGGFGIWHQARNSTGRLPNDRPHVIKLNGTWQVSETLDAGAFFSWMSGTPLNRFGAGPFGFPRFLAPRGSVGRSPSAMDLNVRTAYRVPRAWGPGTRIVLDLLHAGNPRGVVRQDFIAYRAEDAYGNQSTPNLDYLRPTLFQPPMMLRLGVEIGQ